MNIPLQVVSIGVDTVSLLGEKKQDYIFLPDAELYNTHVDERLSVRFSFEEELFVFLQRMIDEGVPFFDSYYQDGYSAYFFAKELVDEGKLRGRIVRSVWEDGEYRIEETDD